jgi:hypothetical protein
MATEKQIKDLNEESLSIPADMLLDVLAIIVTEGLRHEITQVITNRSIVNLLVYIQPTEKRQHQALQNIKDLLQEYNDYRWEETNDTNWRLR